MCPAKVLFISSILPKSPFSPHNNALMPAKDYEKEIRIKSLANKLLTLLRTFGRI